MSRFGTPSKLRDKSSTIFENASKPSKPTQKEPLHRYGTLGSALPGPSLKGGHEFDGVVIDGNKVTIRSNYSTDKLNQSTIPSPSLKRPEISPRYDYTQRSKSPLNTTRPLSFSTYNKTPAPTTQNVNHKTTPNETFLEISTKNLKQFNRTNSSSNLSVGSTSVNGNRPRSTSSVSSRSCISGLTGDDNFDMIL
jgi:hypothetical protein